MRRLIAALVLGSAVLIGSAGSTLALPPNPIRGQAVSDAARVRGEDFDGRRHGRYVASCARSFPTDPIKCEEPIFTD